MIIIISITIFMIILLSRQLDHPDPEVGVVYVEVVGDAPHDDEVHALLLQLPGQGARSSSKTGRRKMIRIAMVIKR